MIRSLGLLVASASIAAAGPPSPLWRAPKTCPHGYSGTPTLLVAIDGGKLRRIERTTGKVLPAITPKLKTPHIVKVIGETMLVTNNKVLAAIDVPSGKQRWERAVAEAQAAKVGDVVFVRHGKTVERLDPATGKAAWTVELPIGGFQIAAGPGHVFVRDAAKIIALDPATGKTQWTTDIGDANDGELRAAGDDALIVNTETGAEELDVVDGATGKRTKLGADTWSAEGAPGRAYVIAISPPTLIAYDLKTGKRAWTAPLLSQEAIVERVDASTLYVTDDHDLIRAFDAGTGKQLWSWGIRSTPFTYMFDGAPSLAYCEGTTLVALDPSAPPVATASISAEGTLSCADCDAGPFTIRIGETVAKTDASGHFAMRATGRGALELTVLLGNVWLPLKSLAAPAKKPYKLGTLTFEMPGQGD